MKILSLLIALLFFVIPVSAQESERIANTIGFGGGVGWYRSADAEEGATYFNALARLRIGNNFALEGLIGYRTAESFDASNLNDYQIGADVSYIPIAISAMFILPVTDLVSPYGMAGVGWYYTIKDYDLAGIAENGIVEHFTDDEEGVPGYHIGFGAEIPLSSSAALHAEWRYLFLGTEIRSLSDAASAEYETKNSDGNQFSIGLLLYM